ncbi:vWA domain-containing protein [Microbacterium sp. A93]|uniref:vWA domain-containing protein n=1 Tax=Microbacterium sp. A93 TaxID=3450716 RepID=UPI003F440741
MIFQPVLNVFLLVLLFAPVVFLAGWMLVKCLRPVAGASAGPAAGAPALMWVLRLLMLLACFMMLLRPGIPGGATQTLATETDIVIVVDTTASIVAEDWDDGQQRLDGVRQDVQSIVDEYPGARFALITFDASAELRLPLTTDTTALISSLEILHPEVTSQSRGSSIGIANRMLKETLASAAESASDRSRMVFYLGDGEQTDSRDPESFAGSAQYIDAGSVLGYGTSEGGPMKITTGGFGSSTDGSAGADGYIEYEGQPAMSVIDDANLQTIAGDLGVSYQLRSADTAIELPEAPTATKNYTESGSVGNVIELYWIFALVMVALLGVELARATMLITQMRGLAIRRGGA